MPDYDYHCLDCERNFSVYRTYDEYGQTPVVCAHCGSENVRRMIGRVRIAKSEDSPMEDLSDPSMWGDIDEDDPKSMARAMRKMGDEMGEEMPAEFDEVVDRLESGESPDEIEKSLPDLGGDEGGGF